MSVKPKRIQRRRTKGWKMPEGCVYVGRPTIFGNPYSGEVFGKDRAIQLYRNTIEGYWNPGVFDTNSLPDSLLLHSAYELHIAYGKRTNHSHLSLFNELRGKDLACWCSVDKPCHADVLLELANA